MQRRKLIKHGVLGAGLGGAALLGYRYTPPAPSKALRDPMTIATELVDSLTPALRDELLVDYNHPFRQYHNRGVWAGGPNIATAGFNRRQLSLVTDLMYAGLSEVGRKTIPNQFFLKVPDALINNLLICGDPGTDRSQIIFTGPHLNLRIGGKNEEGVAFGGPQVYGDQRGNEEPGLPGNVYQPQLAAGMGLYNALDSHQQAAVLQEHSPIQTRIELQGRQGVFSGLPVASLSDSQKSHVRHMIDLTLAPYPAQDVAYAWSCIDTNGGLDALHVSFYADSAYPGGDTYQTYRLEGPAAVFYFRGFPHVHAFFNVAMDGDAPLSVGDIVGTNPAPLEGAGLKSLFERAMLSQSQLDFAFYDLGSAVGRIRPGVVRTGDIYTAESWENKIMHVNLKGADITGEFKAQLDAQAVTLHPERVYSLAVTDYVAEEKLESMVGPAEGATEIGLLRDMVIRHLQAQGFG